MISLHLLLCNIPTTQLLSLRIQSLSECFPFVPPTPHRVTYLGRGFDLLVLPVLLAVGVLLVARLVARPVDEGHVVVVRAGGPSQDAHEVTVVAQVLQQAGHPP